MDANLSPEPDAYHAPVMPEETLRYLNPQSGETMLDATLGGGGHSALIVQKIRPGGTLVGLDRDRDALNAAQIRFAASGTDTDIILLHTDFGKMQFALKADDRAAKLKFDGILFDLGVSSHQLDTVRGFSFRRDEPLNMQMDAGNGPNAADLLASESEAELARILWDYGEERAARKIARRIVEARERGETIATTGQLVRIVEGSIPRAAWPRDIHVATRTFQGLRIAVNDELGQLQSGLDAAIERLNPGGRLVVLSYHSLEDRIVKQTFARESGKTAGAPGSSPAAWIEPEHRATLDLLTRKPVLPTDGETARNPRARSAKLRAAIKL